MAPIIIATLTGLRVGLLPPPGGEAGDWLLATLTGLLVGLLPPSGGEARDWLLATLTGLLFGLLPPSGGEAGDWLLRSKAVLLWAYRDIRKNEVNMNTVKNCSIPHAASLEPSPLAVGHW